MQVLAGQAGVGWGAGDLWDPHKASWAQVGHGGHSDCPNPSLQAAKVEEVASREPLKPAGQWKPDGWLGLHSSLASWPSQPLGVWPWWKLA